MTDPLSRATDEPIENPASSRTLATAVADTLRDPGRKALLNGDVTVTRTASPAAFTWKEPPTIFPRSAATE